jgi:hypothetical protein
VRNPFSKSTVDLPALPKPRQQPQRPLPPGGAEWAESDARDGVTVETLTMEEIDERAGRPLTEAQRAGIDAMIALNAQRNG